MKKTLCMLGLSVLVTSIWLGRQAVGETKMPMQAVVFASANTAHFKAVVPGVSKSVLWGDHDKGPYGAFTKFAPGVDNGMHTHTHPVRIVVLKGAYLYKDEKGAKRVGPGDFILVPAAKKHWSGGDKKEGALFYEESPGKFDLTPVH